MAHRATLAQEGFQLIDAHVSLQAKGLADEPSNRDLERASREGLVRSATTPSRGGWAVAWARSAMAGDRLDQIRRTTPRFLERPPDVFANDPRGHQLHADQDQKSTEEQQRTAPDRMTRLLEWLFGGVFPGPTGDPTRVETHAGFQQAYEEKFP